MITRRRLAGLAAGTATILAMPAIVTTALAQPARLSDGPIRLVVPFPPGGPNDLVARVLAQKLGPILDRVVVIENRSGAGGVVGTDFVAKAPADGKTLCLTSAGAIAISPALLPTMPFDTARDLAPITLVALMPELLAVNKSLPVNTLAELIDYAKKNPGKINFASSGNGSMPHLAGESLRDAAKIDIVHVPYRGAAPAVTDLIAGQVQMMFADMPALMSQVQAGALRPIALASKERSPLLPNTPTLIEAGQPKVEAENWYGLVVSAKTPEPIRALLHDAAVKALADAELKKAYAEQGAIPVGNKPEEFGAFIASENEKWGRIGKAAGVTMD
jgi:tripartite-type tricarboxylate transporter receptor subunit TctC